MNNKLMPALVGGVVLGLLSSIPYVNLANICCCAWAIIGGLIAANLYIKNSPTPVQSGEGAMLGAMSGVLGTVIYCIIGIPLALIIGDVVTPMIINMLENIDPLQAEKARREFELSQNMPFIQKIPSMMLGILIALLLFTLFATLGGLLGKAIFEKRKPDTHIPPPPEFPGQPGGGYGAGA